MTQDKRQNKKAKVAKEEKPVENEEEILQKALDIQEKIDENNDNMEEEIEKIKQKYEKINAPLMKQRGEHTQKVEQFWARVFVAHDTLSDILTANDVEALTYCTDVSAESKQVDEKEEITVTFTFKSNPFFSNNKLTKTVTIGPMDAEIAEQEDEEEFLAPNVQTVQSGIEWKQGQKFTIALDEESDEEESGKAVGEKRNRDDAELDEEQPGLFAIFENETPYDEDIIESLLTEILPNPMEYFFGADDSDDEDDLLGEMGSDDEDIEGEEEEEEAPVVVPVKQEKKQDKKQVKQEKPAKQEQPKQEKKQQPAKQDKPAKQEKQQQQAPKQEKKKEQKQQQQGGKPQQKQQQQGGQKNNAGKQQGGKKQHNAGKQGGKKGKK